MRMNDTNPSAFAACIYSALPFFGATHRPSLLILKSGFLLFQKSASSPLFPSQLRVKLTHSHKA